MNLEAELKEVGTFLVTELTTELIKKKKKAGGQLVKSVKSEVNTTPEGFEIAVIAKSYFKFVDQGVNGYVGKHGSRYSFKRKSGSRGGGGSSAFIESLISWIQARGIATGNKKILSVAFAIRSKVWRDGIKGINILEETLKKASFQYLNKIENAFFIKVSTEIDNILKNGNLNR